MNARVARSVFAIFFARLAINVTKRYAYPFVSPIAASLSVSAESIQNVVALSNSAGLLSPVLGVISEHYGRKAVMVGVMLLITGMCLLAALFSSFGVFVVVMFVIGIGKIIYDPTVQAYFGDTIHFSRRARVMGIVELSWALSLFVAAPVTGYLLEASTLQAVFLFIAVMSALGGLAIWRLVEADRKPDAAPKRIRMINPLTAMRAVSAHPPAVFALLFSLCLTVSHEIFFINYGLWMGSAFDLVLTALGAVTIVIAIGEVIGEFIVITLADRFGVKRTAMVGMLIAAVCFFIIPTLSFSLPLAMFAMVIMFICIEASIVASFPLFTEILPDARAVMMSANMGAHSLGRVAGAAFGGLIYKHSGGSFLVIGIIAGLIGLLAFVIMLRYVPSGGHSPR